MTPSALGQQNKRYQSTRVLAVTTVTWAFDQPFATRARAESFLPCLQTACWRPCMSWRAYLKRW
jgi:hypothetical protein